MILGTFSERMKPLPLYEQNDAVPNPEVDAKDFCCKFRAN
jgi:hypothetical protein